MSGQQLYYVSEDKIGGTGTPTPGFMTQDGTNKTLDKKTVFIFPGNMSHHQDHTLFSSKSGGGLGEKAGNLSRQPDPFPVLSLPTGTSGVTINSAQAKTAIIDLWRAVGAGYSLVLPVRPFQTKTIHPFDKALPNCTGKEPAFWGDNNTTFDPAVAQLYSDQITALDNYLKSPEASKVPAEFQAAFAQGQAAQAALTNATPDLNQVPDFFLTPAQVDKKNQATATSAAPVSQPLAVQPASIAITEDVSAWLTMLDVQESPAFFTTQGSFSKPEPSHHSTNAANSQKYEITYTSSTASTASAHKTTIEVVIDPKTNQSFLSLKDQAKAEAQDYQALALAAIQSSVVAASKATPPADKAGPIRFDDFTAKDANFFAGVKAAVQEYYVQCLTQPQPIKPTIHMTSSDPEVKKLLQKAIADGKQAALEQIKQTATTVNALQAKIDGETLPDTMDALVGALDSKSKLQSDAMVYQAHATLKQSIPALISAAVSPKVAPASKTNNPNETDASNTVSMKK